MIRAPGSSSSFFLPRPESAPRRGRICRNGSVRVLPAPPVHAAQVSFRIICTTDKGMDKRLKAPDFRATASHHDQVFLDYSRVRKQVKVLPVHAQRFVLRVTELFQSHTEEACIVVITCSDTSAACSRKLCGVPRSVESTGDHIARAPRRDPRHDRKPHSANGLALALRQRSACRRSASGWASQQA
jgi:hypothetical protein